MKRTATLLILLVLIVSLPLAGCVDDGYDTDIAGLRNQIASLQKANEDQLEINKKLQAALDSKATTGSVSDLKKEVDDIKSKVGTGMTADLSNYYTKTEVDKTIDKLKNDQSWIATTSNPSNPSNPGTTTGTITTFLDPAAPMFIGDTAGYSFIARFKNTGTTTLYIQPILRIKQASGSAATVVNTLIITSATGSYVPLTFILAPAVPTTLGTNMIQAIPTGGGYNNNGQFPVFGNSELIVTFTIQMDTTVATQWYITIDPSVSQ